MIKNIINKILSSINFKIIVPPFVLFAIIIVFALIVGGGFFDNASEKKLKQLLDTELEYINNKLAETELMYSEISDVYTQVSSFSEILQNYSLQKSTDSLSKLIENSFRNKKFSYSLDIVALDGKRVYSNNSIFRSKEIKNKTILSAINTNNKEVNYLNIYNRKYLVVSNPILVNNTVCGYVVISRPLSIIASNLLLDKNTYIKLFSSNNSLIYSDNEVEGVDVNNLEYENGLTKYNTYRIVCTELNSNNRFVAKMYLFRNVKGDKAFITTLLLYLLLFSVIAFVFGGIIYTYGIYKTLIKPIKTINNKISIVAKGESTTEINSKLKDELGQIANSVDNMIRYSRRNATFASKIGKGELDVEHKVESEKDEIGNALLGMRKALLEARKEEEKYKKEEDKRKWATKGYAEFGEILRQNNDDIEAFSINILRNLISYTDSNQGGLFIYNDSDEDNPILELVASYAYNRRKYKEKEIKLGEGLVGTCAIEKEIIYLTDVPDNYVEITSGLGHANPRNILLVPLKVDDKLFGVIELASFNYFEDYKQEFIKKLAESIASSLSSTKINIMTAQLLEQAQQQQEEMKAQEEELRQNMEEMLATQEESARREAEMTGLYQAINNNSLVADFDLDGNILVINDKFAELFGVDKENFTGVNYNKISSESEGMSNEELWSKIKQGEVVSIKTKVNSSSGKKYWLQQTFAPVKNENGKIYKVINISSDITEEREKEIELRQQQEEMKSQEEEMLQNMEEMLAVQEELNIVEAKSKIILEVVGPDVLYSEYNFDGVILDVNKNFIKLLGMESADMFIGKNYLDFSDLSENKKELEEILEKFKNGEIVKRKSKITMPDGKEYVFNEEFTPVLDEFDKVVRIIEIANVI